MRRNMYLCLEWTAPLKCKEDGLLCAVLWRIDTIVRAMLNTPEHQTENIAFQSNSPQDECVCVSVLTETFVQMSDLPCFASYFICWLFW